MDNHCSEFKKWPKTRRWTDVQLRITQKLDGTNALIAFDEQDGHVCVRCGSRNRWLDKDNDNFKFYEFVMDNRADLYEVLGRGKHYGEFCGPGIQTSEGLKEKMFFSFNSFLEVRPELRHTIQPVPTLYIGPFSTKAIGNALLDLKQNGSKVNGFEKPEGIIVNVQGVRYKVYMNQLPNVVGPLSLYNLQGKNEII